MGAGRVLSSVQVFLGKGTAMCCIPA